MDWKKLVVDTPCKRIWNPFLFAVLAGEVKLLYGDMMIENERTAGTGFYCRCRIVTNRPTEECGGWQAMKPWRRDILIHELTGSSAARMKRIALLLD